MKRILVIDDDQGILELIDELLSFRFTILKALDAPTGLALAASEQPDLIILDLVLQQQSGHNVCRLLREQEKTKHIPILIYTGSDDIENLTQAFSQGADDYVIKSARPKELVARVLAKIRRLEEAGQTPDILECGNLILDGNNLKATVAGQSVSLTVLDFNLLRFFLMNRLKVVSREKIIEAVWKNPKISNRTVDTHMVFLRKKLAEFNHEFSTVYGAGYILQKPLLNDVKNADTTARKSKK